jgi:hypothetical protein
MMAKSTQEMDLYQQETEKHIPYMKNASDTVEWKNSGYCSY